MKRAWETLEELAPLFNSQCQVTLKKFKSRGFTLHHIEEIEDDVLWSDYKKLDNGRDKYYNDLAPLVEDIPERFALITNPIHIKLDHPSRGITRLGLDNGSRQRFCDLAMQTVHIRRKK